VHLDASHPDAPALREYDELVAPPHMTRPQRSGDHGARPADREHAVDVQAGGRAVLGARGHRRRGTIERRPELVEASSASR
jgi:hypothetical protein